MHKVVTFIVGVVSLSSSGAPGAAVSSVHALNRASFDVAVSQDIWSERLGYIA